MLKNDNSFEQKNNPFANECKNCIKDFWEYLSSKTNELNSKCSTNTYIIIEKLKND